MAKKLPPIPPGEILLEEFLRPMEISQNQLAKNINVPANRISQIINGKREITADTALRLGQYFKMEPEFWLNLQVRYNMKIAKEKSGNQIKKEVKIFQVNSLNHVSFSILEVERPTRPTTTPDISFQVTEHELPAVFVSYRWGEDDAWVDQFVSDISKRGIAVIYDRWVQEKLEWQSEEEIVNALLSSMEQCHAFIPIFTPEYLRRAGFVDGVPISGTHIDDGVVFDEFERSLLLSHYKRIETIAVLLAGKANILPRPFNESNILDMRSLNQYEAQVNRLCGYLHNDRSVKNRGPRSGEMQGMDLWFKEDWSD